MTAWTDSLIGGLDGRSRMYDAVMSDGNRVHSTRPEVTRFRRIASWLPIALMFAALAIVTSGVRFAVFPEAVRVDRGSRGDVYSWEGLVALVLLTVGSLGMALTIKFDPLARPETVMVGAAQDGSDGSWVLAVGSACGASPVFFSEIPRRPDVRPGSDSVPPFSLRSV